MSFSTNDPLSPLVTKDARIGLKENYDGSLTVDIRYAWGYGNTGWELSINLPTKDNLFREAVTVPGTARLWSDCGRSEAKYSGDFVFCATMAEGGTVSMTVSGTMEDAFELSISRAIPTYKEPEDEPGLLLVEQAIMGYDVFVNQTNRDIILTMKPYFNDNHYTFTLPAGSQIEKVRNMAYGEYEGIDSMESISVNCQGKTIDYTNNQGPFSPEFRTNKQVWKPVIRDGIMAILVYSYSTYDLSFIE